MRFRTGMTGRRKCLRLQTVLDDLPGIHDDHLVGDGPDVVDVVSRNMEVSPNCLCKSLNHFRMPA